MKNSHIAVAILAAIVLVVGVSTLLLLDLTQNDGSSPSPTPPSGNNPTIYTYSIVNTYPHSTDAYTQGLVYADGVFFESTGNYGASSLRRVDIANGHVTKSYRLPDEYYSEGLTLVNDRLIQLTWRNNIGFVYDKDTFDAVGNFSYSTEGWGLTFDGNRLIMSDGSSSLYFLDPNTFKRTGEINVHDASTPVGNLNELEYVNGDVYANIWLQQRIAIINPATGAVKGYIDLSGIYQSSDPNSVLNGIAYDVQNNRLFVTGKYWPNLYEIQISPKT